MSQIKLTTFTIILVCLERKCIAKYGAESINIDFYNSKICVGDMFNNYELK